MFRESHEECLGWFAVEASQHMQRPGCRRCEAEKVDVVPRFYAGSVDDVDDTRAKEGAEN